MYIQYFYNYIFLNFVNRIILKNLRAASSLMTGVPVALTPLYVHCVGITLKKWINVIILRVRRHSREHMFSVKSPYDGIHLNPDAHLRQTVYTILAGLAGGYRKYHLPSESIICIRKSNSEKSIFACLFVYLVIHVFLVSAPYDMFYLQLFEKLSQNLRISNIWCLQYFNG